MKKRNNREELSHAMAHYLMAIVQLTEAKKTTRVSDIAQTLKITKGSASIALAKLKKMDLIINEKHARTVKLTEKGEKAVEKILQGKELFTTFFHSVLGIPESVAERDACLMEHLLGTETQEAFQKFIKKNVSDKE